jgi:multidrug efflux system outer membrane protein
MTGRAPRGRRTASAWCMAAVTLALSATGGCTVGPDYRRPEAVAAMPAAFAESTGEWKVAEPKADLSKGPWWEIFGDEELNRLEAEAATSNQDLAAAAARFEQARASADVARSGLFPRIGVGAAATRQQDSANRPLNSTGEAAGKGYIYDNFTIPFDFSYELDLWGRVRRQREAAGAGQEAAVADVESVKLAIAAEVAADYFTLRSLDVEAVALVASIEAYEKSLELTRRRRAGGLSSDLDVAQAETVLNAAAAQLPGITRSRQHFEHALAVLTGQAAPLFHVAERPFDLEPPVVEPDLPSALLERRPDVASAERRMAAANANIGVATAAFFPTVKLNGLAGLQSTSSGSLFDWASRFWAVGPSLSLPLFDGGRISAGVRASRGAYEETVARYRATVLAAFSEVEDNLAAQRLLAEAWELEARAWVSAHRQLEIAQNRYRAGLVGYLQVTAAQSAALERDRSRARLRGQQFAACAALVKSLGGGWQGLDRERWGR